VFLSVGKQLTVLQQLTSTALCYLTPVLYLLNEQTKQQKIYSCLRERWHSSTPQKLHISRESSTHWLPDYSFL